MLRHVCAVIVAVLVVPAPALAWGTAGHRLIMRRAIDILPPEIKPFFEHYRDELVLRTIDPDLWRLAGWADNPHHFLDLGADEFGPYPFTALPREHGAAVEKFGTAALNRLGLLPWREAEEFGNLRRAMEAFKRNSIFAPSNTVLFAAVAAHYIQDSTQPLHASNNFDGQLTKQNGVHARFEVELVERYEAQLVLRPEAPRPITNPRDFAFDQLLASYKGVQPLLDADREAAAGKDTYDDDYFAKFFAKIKPLMEERLSAGITATASIFLGAWEAAGRPTLRTVVPPAVQKIPKP